MLFGETAPRGTPNVVAPLAFLRGALCLDASYRKGALRARRARAASPTTPTRRGSGPRFRPPDRDDVTIGVLPRLTNALDRAARAGAIRRGLGIYLTEFGIQSTPDPFVGVSLARQSEYLAIAEHMAYVNPRVRSFSQYLLSDDQPRKGGRVERYGGFESGLRRSDGRAKPAYDAFRLPLAAEAYGRSDVLWGRVRPRPAQTKVTILASRRRGKRSSRCARSRRTTAASSACAPGTTTGSATACGGRRRRAHGLHRPADPRLLSDSRVHNRARRIRSAPWRGSSGSSGTARPCRTNPRPTTPTAS